MISFGWVVGGAIAFITIFVMIMFSIPFYSYWMRYLYVRIGGGGLILVKFISSTDHYHRVGKLSKLTITTKKRNAKTNTELTIPEKRPVFYRSMGATFLDCDEKTNALVTSTFDAIEGFDEETYEDIVVRAMMKEGGNINYKLLLLGLALILGGVAAILIITNQQDKAEILRHTAVLDGLKDIAKKCISTTI